MKKIILLITCVFFTLPLMAQTSNEPEVYELWPNGAPTENGITEEEKEIFPTFIAYIKKATLIVYKPQRPNGTCIICCPGGGYFGLSMLNEGSNMATWLNNQGVTFVLLKYRMPNGHKQIPLEDGEQAIRMVRAHAAEWGVNPNKVGIMGSSAGGHFAATLSTLYTSKETRPDFSILFYPVISMETGITHQGSRENLLGKNPTAEEVSHYDLDKQVTADTPPAFLVLAADDETVNPLNSISYYQQLLAHQVKNSVMFIYPYGGHGFGFQDSFKFKREWTGELEAWLRDIIF